MNIDLFYFSGTGNTKYACDKFKVIMEQSGNFVTLHNIETPDIQISSILKQADIIGFSYPIYGANLPKIMDKFINSHFYNKQITKNVFIISTVGVINAFGPFIIKNRLKQSGLTLKWHYVYCTVNNTAVRRINQNQLDEKHNKQKIRFEKFCNAINLNKPFFNGIGPWILGGYVVRNILRKPIANHYKSFYIENSLCTNCNICVSNCPMDAITLINGRYIFSEKCTTCFRCKNKCPKNAIKDKKYNK